MVKGVWDPSGALCLPCCAGPAPPKCLDHGTLTPGPARLCGRSPWHAHPVSQGPQRGGCSRVTRCAEARGWTWCRGLCALASRLRPYPRPSGQGSVGFRIQPVAAAFDSPRSPGHTGAASPGSTALFIPHAPSCGSEREWLGQGHKAGQPQSLGRDAPPSAAVRAGIQAAPPPRRGCPGLAPVPRAVPDAPTVSTGPFQNCWPGPFRRRSPVGPHCGFCC